MDRVGRGGRVRPVGAAYKVVMKKLGPPGPLLTANMDPELLDKVIGTLFPRQDSDARQIAPSSPSSDDGGVERRATGHRRGALRGNNEDGIPRRCTGSGWNPGPSLRGVIMAPRIRHPYTRCLKEGVYPRTWRTSRLVLLRKEGRPLDSPSAYRPICLLDEAGKLFERIIAARLEAHMSERIPGWHDSQYGFRRGRSTVDAVIRVKSMAEEMVEWRWRSP
jgi:hypothetical protein